MDEVTSSKSQRDAAESDSDHLTPEEKQWAESLSVCGVQIKTKLCCRTQEMHHCLFFHSVLWYKRSCLPPTCYEHSIITPHQLPPRPPSMTLSNCFNSFEHKVLTSISEGSSFVGITVALLTRDSRGLYRSRSRSKKTRTVETLLLTHWPTCTTCGDVEGGQGKLLSLCHLALTRLFHPSRITPWIWRTGLPTSSQVIKMKAWTRC